MGLLGAGLVKADSNRVVPAQPYLFMCSLLLLVRKSIHLALLLGVVPGINIKHAFEISYWPKVHLLVELLSQSSLTCIDKQHQAWLIIVSSDAKI